MSEKSSTNLTTLDFEQIKSNLKSYLSNQEIFQDYDFEASNINVLLDILAHNTQLNAFYLSMIGSEMFLDSAILEDSVVSHAKELNYLPRSFRSAYANVSLTIAANGVSSVAMPRGTSFTSRLGARNYTFVTDRNYVLGGSDGTFYANNILIYEGDYITDSYIVNYNDRSRYLISSPTVDTTSVRVTVIEDNGETTLQYMQADSLFGLDSSSKVFFLQGAEDGKYEVVFGDDVIGRRPKDRALVVLEYRSCNGELPNGLNTFVSDGAIDGWSDVTVTTNQRAKGGSVSETVESVKFNAPRAFTTQERAVTAKDYSTLLRAEFAEINDVTAYGGEQADPPRYGKVIVSVDLEDSNVLPPSNRDKYRSFLKSRSPLSIDPVFVDPAYTFLEIVSNVKYDINLTDLSEDDIRSLVISQILDFNDDNLDGFEKTFRYSKFVAAIDSAQQSIVSNDTEARMIKTISPITNKPVNYDIDFGVEFRDDVSTLEESHPEGDLNIVQSGPFLFKGRQVFLEDNGNGLVYLMSFADGEHERIRRVGTVDYERGFIQLEALEIDGFTGPNIQIFARAKGHDISTVRNTILSIQESDITVTVTPLRGTTS